MGLIWQTVKYHGIIVVMSRITGAPPRPPDSQKLQTIRDLYVGLVHLIAVCFRQTKTNCKTVLDLYNPFPHINTSLQRKAKSRATSR
jgi:hypothetical protein